jgi:TPR repeat protein
VTSEMRLLAFVTLALAWTAASGQPLSLYQQAQDEEKVGRMPAAVKLYTRAAREGNSKAALRLAEIYDTGANGVARNYEESLKWRNAARVLGPYPPLIGDFPNRR